MCEPMVWLVDLDVSLVDVPRTAERVLWYLMENGVLRRRGGGTWGARQAQPPNTGEVLLSGGGNACGDAQAIAQKRRRV